MRKTIAVLLGLALIAGGMVAQVTLTKCSAVAAGPVAHENECSSGTPTFPDGNSQLTCSLTVTSSTTNIIVGTAAASTVRSVQSVTIGACNGTVVGTQTVTGSGMLEIWKCATPPSAGSQTVTVTWDAGGANSTITAVSFTNGTGNYGTGVTNSGNTSPASVTVSSAANHRVADFKFRDQATGTCASSDTPDGTAFTNSNCLDNVLSLEGSHKAGSGSGVTNSWTLGVERVWGEVGVDIY